MPPFSVSSYRVVYLCEDAAECVVAVFQHFAAKVVGQVVDVAHRVVMVKQLMAAVANVAKVALVFAALEAEHFAGDDLVVRSLVVFGKDVAFTCVFVEQGAAVIQVADCGARGQVGVGGLHCSTAMYSLILSCNDHIETSDSTHYAA